MVIFDHSEWSVQFQGAFKFDSKSDLTPLNPSKAHFGRFSLKPYQYTMYKNGWFLHIPAQFQPCKDKKMVYYHIPLRILTNSRLTPDGIYSERTTLISQLTIKRWNFSGICFQQ